MLCILAMNIIRALIDGIVALAAIGAMLVMVCLFVELQSYKAAVGKLDEEYVLIKKEDYAKIQTFQKEHLHIKRDTPAGTVISWLCK